jgi:fatty-acyl-CoA synthase
MLHADLLGERARLTPDKTALVWVPSGARYSYAELDARASRLAASWIDVCGFAPGDRVGLIAHNRVEFIDAFFAAAKSGIILVPFGTKLTPHEIDYIARDAGLAGFVYDGAFADTVRPLAAALPPMRWMALDAPAVDGHARVEELLPESGRPLPRRGPEDVC